MALFELKDGRQFRAFTCDDEQVVGELVKLGVLEEDWRERYPLLQIDYKGTRVIVAVTGKEEWGCFRGVLVEMETIPEATSPSFRKRLRVRKEQREMQEKEAESGFWKIAEAKPDHGPYEFFVAPNYGNLLFVSGTNELEEEEGAPSYQLFKVLKECCLVFLWYDEDDGEHQQPLTLKPDDYVGFDDSGVWVWHRRMPTFPRL